MFKIAKYPDPILRKTAKPISDFNDELKKMASDMAEVMYEDDGIGLAAPQVSKSLRLIVIGLGHGDFKTYVNPEITFFSKEKTPILICGAKASFRALFIPIFDFIACLKF
mgnify:CR=1 FL=1